MPKSRHSVYFIIKGTCFELNKKLVIIPIMGVIVLAVVSTYYGNTPVSNEVFHETLADPKLYQEGAYSNTFFAKEGTYSFRFVPNGDSPKILEISLKGADLDFNEQFELQGTIHDTGISEYYTWDYQGKKTIIIPQNQELQITINPHGNVMGPVSVYLEEN